MSSTYCIDKILKQLNQNGISNSNIHISYETGTVTVTTDQPSSVVLNSIEKTGMKAVLKGYGSATRKRMHNSHSIIVFFKKKTMCTYIYYYCRQCELWRCCCHAG